MLPQTPVTTVMCKYGYTYRGPTKEYKAGYGSDYKAYDPGYKAESNPAACTENTVYQTEKRTRQVPKTVTHTKPAGGFDACMGPISYYTAHSRGVDDWACHTNCYVRKDPSGREYQARSQDFQGGGLIRGKLDLKPKGGLIRGKSGPLYTTLWSLWPKGGPSDPQTSPRLWA